MDHDADYYGDMTIARLEKRIEQLLEVQRGLYLRIEALDQDLLDQGEDDE